MNPTSPTRRRLSVLFALILGVLSPSIARPQTQPLGRRIPFQGRVQGVDTSKDLSITVTLRNAAGMEVFGPESLSVRADSLGSFVFLIGSSSPPLDTKRRDGSSMATGSNGVADLDEIPEPTLRELWVRMVVDGKQLSPDQRLVPSFHAASAAIAWGAAPEGFQLKDISATLQPDVVNPTGMVVAFAGTTAPPGWALCNGASVSVSDPAYARLFGVLKYTHGGSGGSFNLPDYRGRFLRGVDDQGRDPDRTTRTAMNPGGNAGALVGSVQTDSFQTHKHGITDKSHAHFGHIRWSAGSGGGTSLPNPFNVNYLSSSSEKAQGAAQEIITDREFTGITGTNQPADGRASSESRPSNAYVNYIIKL